MDSLSSGIIEFNLVKKTGATIAVKDLDARLQDINTILWIHCDLNDQNYYQDIAKIVKLPDIVTTYLNDSSTIPRFDDAEESLTIKIQVPLVLTPDKHHPLSYATLIIHLTKHYCLTLSSKPTPALQEFMLHYEKSLRYARTPGFILFLILDNILNDYSEILFFFEALCDHLDLAAHATHKNHYREVMKEKKMVIKSKRYISAIRDILARISGRNINVVSDHCRKSLLDLYSHSQAIVNETDSVREVLNGLLDQIDNGIMHKMSETMTVLTAYATIFMPPTLITSMYGMNFVNMPELNWKYGYYFALSLMLISAMLLYFTFKRRKWF